MAANPINIVARRHAVQYTGTNSGDIIALGVFAYNNSSVTSGVWTFQSPPDSSTYVVNPNDWIVFLQNAVEGHFNPSDFAVFYQCNALCTDIITPTASVRAIGVAAVPTLLLSGTANVDVTIRPTMPNTSFTPYAAKFAGISLTDLQINSVTVVNTSTIRVAVQNVGLVTLTGASVMAHAVA